SCAGCARVHRLMQQTTRVFADLPASAPSSRVDQAVMAAIAAQGNRQVPANVTSDEGEREERSYNTRTPAYIPRTSKRGRRMVGASLAVALVGGVLKSRAVKTVVPVALVAMLLLAFLTTTHYFGSSTTQAFRLPFNLAELRGDIDAHRAVYLDQDVFRGQSVYRIRARNGLVLLLDMHYRPVNVLRGAIGPGTGAPIYDVLALMPASHVSHSMWDM